MVSRFLFRLDGSKENDEFMTLRRTRDIDLVYSGTPMKVGPGWIPDFLEVSTDSATARCDLTLIELEATDIAARASSRKYLPENSSAIVQAFITYLNGVLSQCRATADPRLEAFQQLRDFLARSSSVTVRTAGALRTSPEFLEELLLIDQPEHQAVQLPQTPTPRDSFIFQGERLLSRVDGNGLRRTIRILDAVIMGRDHSGGTLKSWRNVRTKPLHKAVSAHADRYPGLQKLLFSRTDTGIQVNCDHLARELADLWSSSERMRVNQDQVVASITNLFPIALSLQEHEQMQRVFDQAWVVLKGKAS